MQGALLFLVLLVTAASFSLNISFPVGPCFNLRGIERYLEKKEDYLRKVPPCVDNVNKTKIYEYYLQYDNDK